MKKLLIPLTILLLISLGITQPIYAQQNQTKVIIDGEEIEFDVPCEYRYKG
jgi:hypothetical protein